VAACQSILISSVQQRKRPLLKINSDIPTIASDTIAPCNAMHGHVAVQINSDMTTFLLHKNNACFCPSHLAKQFYVNYKMAPA
jgi:GTP:adenosylcobinamide-phosphate guanylyltransferase